MRNLVHIPKLLGINSWIIELFEGNTSIEELDLDEPDAVSVVLCHRMGD
jgi:hypothetical protein